MYETAFAGELTQGEAERGGFTARPKLTPALSASTLCSMPAFRPMS